MYRLLLTLLVLLFVPSTFAYERIVLLAPAAGDIVIQLNAKEKVVGVTRSNHDFPDALKIGSHIKPNVELIKGLDPDLLVISSNRFFTDQLAAQIDAEVVKYDPTSLDEILLEINRFGELLERESQAKQLIQRLRGVQAKIVPLNKRKRVVFEVTQSPFIVAGRRSIVHGIVTAAGGELLGPEARKVAKFNLETVLLQQPDYYLYQVGPMNKNPTPPSERPNYQMLAGEVIKVDQLAFSRATTNSFYQALALNKRFRGEPRQ